ncbi:MAG: hypothetical protein ACF8OB_10560 [Phycisphaeraceae bacterium JB051]
MTRHNTIVPVARRRRTRPATVNIKFDQLIRHASSGQNVPAKRHADDWAMEWLYEDFTLWAQIKLTPQALSKMMRENELLAQFNSNSNSRKITVGVENDPLGYLVNLLNRHEDRKRK